MIKKIELWSPKSLNEGYKNIFNLNDYKSLKPFQDECEIDFYKDRIGIEIQFGKYAFMGYDIFSKMPIFYNKGLIKCGIELVLSNTMLKDMSTGVSSFNQIVMDIKARGESDLDIPVLILGFI